MPRRDRQADRAAPRRALSEIPEEGGRHLIRPPGRSRRAVPVAEPATATSARSGRARRRRLTRDPPAGRPHRPPGAAGVVPMTVELAGPMREPPSVAGNDETCAGRISSACQATGQAVERRSRDIGIAPSDVRVCVFGDFFTAWIRDRTASGWVGQLPPRHRIPDGSSRSTGPMLVANPAFVLGSPTRLWYRRLGRPESGFCPTPQGASRDGGRGVGARDPAAGRGRQDGAVVRCSAATVSRCSVVCMPARSCSRRLPVTPKTFSMTNQPRRATGRSTS